MSGFSSEKSAQFWEAAQMGNLQFVETLSLDPEVDLDWQTNGFPWTPFSVACQNSHVAVVKYLLDFSERMIDYNRPDNAQTTAFLQACWSGRDEVVEMLVSDGRIDVNQGDEEGRTPLWFACFAGNLGLVRLLLVSRVKINTNLMEKGSEKTPGEIARLRGMEEVAGLMEAFERDPEKVKEQLRKELGHSGAMAGELFALVVYVSDGYLKIPAEKKAEDAERFFNMANRLPMDLQMLLCNRVFGLEDSIIKAIHSEKGFRRFVKGF